MASNASDGVAGIAILYSSLVNACEWAGEQWSSLSSVSSGQRETTPRHESSPFDHKLIPSSDAVRRALSHTHFHTLTESLSL